MSWQGRRQRVVSGALYLSQVLTRRLGLGQVFQIVSQAIVQNFFPRFHIYHTSRTHQGQACRLLMFCTAVSRSKKKMVDGLCLATSRQSEWIVRKWYGCYCKQQVPASASETKKGGLARRKFTFIHAARTAMRVVTPGTAPGRCTFRL